MLSTASCFFAMGLHVGPTYRIKLSHHLVLGRPRGLLCPQGIHPVTLIVHLLSRLFTKCHAHLCLISRVFLIMSVTTLLPDPVSSLSVLEGDSYHYSLHLFEGCDQFLKFGVAKRPGLTAIYRYWECTFVKCFPLQSHWDIFLLRDVVQLAEYIVWFLLPFFVPSHGP